MKKNISLLIATLLFFGTVQAQISWNTFLGGSGYDVGYEIDMDADGNIYIAGSGNNPWGSPIRAHQGGVSDAFVAKLSGNGTLIWLTFLGGPGEDIGHSIVVDRADGSVYITGQSREPWGSSTWVEPYHGQWDGFVAKLNSNGVLQWNSFVGGQFTNESAYGITLSGSTLYLTGGANFQCFIGKMNTNGNLLGYDLFGSNDLIGFEVKLSPGGILYVFGRATTSLNTSSWWGSPVENYHGGNDAFLAAFNINTVFGGGANHGMLWYTFLGCSGNDWGYGLCVDENDNAYVSGLSGCTWGSPVSIFTSGEDAFLAKYNSSGARQWNTFLGSYPGMFEWSTCVNLGSDGIVYMSGSFFNGPFVAQYNRDNGARLCLNNYAPNTGGGARDLVYKNGIVYTVGESYVSWGSPIDPHKGNADISVFKIGACDITASAGTDEHIYIGYSPNQCITKTAAVTGGTGPFIYNWTLSRALLPGESISGVNTASVTLCLTDTAELCITVTGDNCCSSSDCAMIFVEDVRCGSGNNQKVFICHNGNTICVDANAVPAHLAHGDYVGPCGSSFAIPEIIKISKNDEPALSVYPNPGNGKFTVTLNLTEGNINDGILRVINSNGKVVKQRSVNHQSRIQMEINIPGIYIMQFTSNDRVITRKFVVVQ